MYKIFDFNKPFVLYDDKPYVQVIDGKLTDKPMMMNLVLSDNLRTLTKGNIVKIDDWGRALFKTGKLILDKSDEELLITIIENFPNMYINVKRQMLDVFYNEGVKHDVTDK